MNRRITQELMYFDQHIEALKIQYNIKKVASDAFIVSPKGFIGTTSPKSIPLTLQALTHGDEVYGICIFNQLLHYLKSNLVTLKQPLALILGNRDAALQQQRFLEKDLNRSFMSTERNTV